MPMLLLSISCNFFFLLDGFTNEGYGKERWFAGMKEMEGEEKLNKNRILCTK